MQEIQKHNDFATQIALYRYYFQRISPSIDKIIQSLLQGCRSLCDDSKFMDGNTLRMFFDYKSWIFSPHIPRLCNQISIKLLKKQCKKVRKNCDGKSNKQLGAAEIKTLSLFLNYNYENHLILGQQSNALFSQEDLLNIFDCSFQQIQFLKQKFMKNKQKIRISRVKYAEKQLFNTFILIKQKQSISKRLQCQFFPPQSSIQESLLKITQIFKEYTLKLQNNRQSLSNLCKQHTKFDQKKLIEGQLKQLILENRAKLYQFTQASQLKDMYMQCMSKLKDQLYDKKEERKNLSAKYILALQLFNYYKYKYQHRWAQDIYTRIQKQHLFKGQRIMREFLTPDLLAQCDIDNQHYIKIVMKMIQFHYQRKQILFIDHIQFYRKEFHTYNLLSRKISTQDINCSLSIPNEDCLLYLFTGTTTQGLMFYNIIKDKLNTYSYYDKIKDIYKKLAEKCPKAIVIFTTDELRYHQLFKLKNLIIFLQENGIILYLLPVSFKNINPNKRIQLFIKYSFIKDLSQRINDPDFKELLQAILIQKLKDQFLKKSQSAKKQFWLQSRNIICKQCNDQDIDSQKLIMMKNRKSFLSFFIYNKTIQKRIFYNFFGIIIVNCPLQRKIGLDKKNFLSSLHILFTI